MLRKQKKLYTVLLAVLLALTMLPPVAFAEDEPDGATLDAAQGESAPAQADAVDGAAPEAAGDALAQEAVAPEEPAELPGDEPAAAPDEATPGQDSEEVDTGEAPSGDEGDTPDLLSLTTLADTPEPTPEEGGSLTPLAGVTIDETTFPDATFRAYVTTNFDTNPQDGTLSDAEIAAVERIGVSERGITTLKGIEHFTALTELYCAANQLTTLDLSKNTALTILHCYSNQLTSLDVSKSPMLKVLWGGDNRLASLDVSKNTNLTHLECQINQLTSLDVSKNTALGFLACNNNQLTSLDVSKNTELGFLACNNNQLTSLDVSKNTNLTDLECGTNQLTSLDVSKNTALGHLFCSGNQLPTLDVSANTALTSLYCYRNQFRSLDLSKNIVLETLDCTFNQLTSLDVSANAALKVFYCGANQLTALDISANTALTRFECFSNQLLDVIGLPANLQSFYGYGQVATVFVQPDPEVPGSYLSAATYDLGTHGIALADEAASFDAVGGRFSTSSLDTPIDFTTIAADQEITGTVTFVDSSASGIPIDATTFPDDNFRAYVGDYLDTSGDGTLSDAEIAAVEDISVINNGITTLKGIEYFTALEYLDCPHNQLTSLDVSANTALRELYCDNNQLTSLDVGANTTLTTLYCYLNQLTTLDVSGATALKYLDCGTNQLTSLDVSKNTVLEGFSCSYNQLTTLDVSKNTALDGLECDGNQLTSLDVSENAALRILWCSENQLTSLNVGNNTKLEWLSCYSNQLTSLDVSGNTALGILWCSGNRLTSLDVSKNTALENFACDGNRLLDVIGLPAGLTNFDASSQAVTIAVQPDPDVSGSYLSDAAYPLATGHSIALDGTAAGYDTASGRFSTTSLDTPIGFTTDDGTGQTLTGTITFTLQATPAPPVITDLDFVRTGETTFTVNFTSDQAGMFLLWVYQPDPSQWAYYNDPMSVGYNSLSFTLKDVNLEDPAAAKTVVWQASNPPGDFSTLIESTLPAWVAPSASKDITSFTVAGASGAISGTSINVEVPYGTDVTALTPEIEHTGASVSPAGAQDFSSPLTYTVTAEDGTTKAYTVTATVSTEVPVITAPATWEGEGAATVKLDAAVGDFVRLLLDGVEVDSADYTVSEGSTVITLHEDYLATLSVGDHVLTAIFTDGQALIPLRIGERASGDATVPPTAVGGGSLPATGDASSLALMAAAVLMAASGASGICALLAGRARRRRGAGRA